MAATDGGSGQHQARPGRCAAMTRQLNLSCDEQNLMLPARACNPSEEAVPFAFADELDGSATRVRTCLRNMSATILEIGRELRTVKRCLRRRQFHDWVARTFGLVPSRAELMIRAA